MSIRQPAVVHLASTGRHLWRPGHIVSRPQACLHRLQHVTQLVPRQRGLGSKKRLFLHEKA